MPWFLLCFLLRALIHDEIISVEVKIDQIEVKDGQDEKGEEEDDRDGHCNPAEDGADHVLRVIVLRSENGCGSGEGEEKAGGRYDHHYKGLVVLTAYTIVDPNAMMVEATNAST